MSHATLVQTNSMLNRRKFVHSSVLTSIALLIRKPSLAEEGSIAVKDHPIVLSTWAQNVKASAAAWSVLGQGGRALDAVEQGVQIPEADPSDQSVGYGGLPDRDGKVTLDACIMDETGNCGAVMFLEGIPLEPPRAGTSPTTGWAAITEPRSTAASVRSAPRRRSCASLPRPRSSEALVRRG